MHAVSFKVHGAAIAMTSALGSPISLLPMKNMAC